MKKLMLELTDGKHIVSTPTFYALQLMQENGIDLLGKRVEVTPAIVPKILAALLTDAEPLDDHDNPSVVWNPVAVAKAMRIDAYTDYLDLVTELITDALTSGDEPKAENRPNRKKAAAGETKP